LINLFCAAFDLPWPISQEKVLPPQIC